MTLRADSAKIQVSSFVPRVNAQHERGFPCGCDADGTSLCAPHQRLREAMMADDGHQPSNEGIAFCAHCDFSIRYQMGSPEQAAAGLSLAAHAVQCDHNMLVRALKESLKLQSHYAALLNMHDGGRRRSFDSIADWLARLKATSSGGNQQ